MGTVIPGIILLPGQISLKPPSETEKFDIFTPHCTRVLKYTELIFTGGGGVLVTAMKNPKYKPGSHDLIQIFKSPGEGGI